MQGPYVIEVDGRETPYPPKDGERFTLRELQEAVGGYIECLSIRKTGDLMFVNEDGRPKCLPLNPKASALYGAPICGRALILHDATMIR